MKTLTIFNRKGGVGKTTAVCALGTFFGAIGNRVLIVDLDTQANATQFYLDYDIGKVMLALVEGTDVESDFEYTICDVLTDRNFDIHDAIMHTTFPNVDCIPSFFKVKEMVDRLSDEDYPLAILDDQLEKVADEYDIVIVDTAPADDRLTKMAISASNAVLTPLTADLHSLHGVQLVKSLIKPIQNRSKKVNFMGCYFNNYRAKESLHKMLRESLMASREFKYIDLPIRSSSKAGQFQYIQESLINSGRYLKDRRQAKDNQIAEDYIRLGEYILENI